MAKHRRRVANRVAISQEQLASDKHAATSYEIAEGQDIGNNATKGSRAKFSIGLVESTLARIEAREEIVVCDHRSEVNNECNKK